MINPDPKEKSYVDFVLGGISELDDSLRAKGISYIKKGSSVLLNSLSPIRPYKLNTSSILELIDDLGNLSGALLTKIEYYLLSEKVQILFNHRLARKIKSIAKPYQNPLTQKIQSIAIPIIGIVAIGQGFFKLAKINSHFLFHTTLNCLNSSLSYYFINNNLSVQSLENAIEPQKPINKGIELKGEYIYALTYAVSHIAVTYFTRNPFLSYSVPLACAQTADWASVNLMNSYSKVN